MSANAQHPARIVIQTPYATQQPSAVSTRYYPKASIVCGAIHLTIGIFLVFLNFLGILLKTCMANSAYGILCGVLYIVTGSFGLVAGKLRSKCTIMAFMVLSISSAASCLILLILGVVAAKCDNDEGEDYDYYYDRYRFKSWRGNVALSSTNAIVAVVEALVAIASSGLGCAGTCACCYSRLKQTVIFRNPYTTHGEPPPYSMTPDPVRVPDAETAEVNGGATGEVQTLVCPEQVAVDDREALV